MLGFLLSSCSGHQSFLDQTIIDSNLKTYSADEKQAIFKDLAIVESICFEGVTASQTKQYIDSAGGPGARKSTTLERFLAQEAASLSNFAYLDPDQRALKFMAHTYQNKSLNARQIATQTDYSLIQKSAYEKWRDASNYITATLLEKAFRSGYSVVHGTTSTGPALPDLLKKIKAAGYKVTFLLCGSSDQFRRDAINYRLAEQRFYQSTPEDAVTKGLAFPQRMQFYFEQGDTLMAYWSNSLNHSEQLAATFIDGTLTILDKVAYENFVQKYEADRAYLAIQQNLNLLPWEEIIAAYQHRFKK
jgi:hypothetical protein